MSDIGQPDQLYSPSEVSEEESIVSTELADSIMPILRSKFFDVFHPVTPIIDRARFEAQLAQEPTSNPIQALSHAIGALGSLALEDLQFPVNACYDQARHLLDLCDRQEDPAQFADLRVIQACIFLALYELKRPNSTRAWITLGRAIRLSQVTCLEAVATQRTPEAGDLVPLPPPSSPEELEEWRRTFWLLYLLDGHSVLRTNISSFYNGIEIQTLLPSAVHSALGAEDCPVLTIEHVLSNPDNMHLSPFASNVMVIHILLRCMDHNQSQAKTPSYPFWDTYFRLDEMITHFRENVFAETFRLERHSAYKSLSIILSVNLAAGAISLHETAMTKVESEQLPGSLWTEAALKCRAASQQIEEALQTGMSLDGNGLLSFRHSCFLYVWAMNKAISAELKMLNHGPSITTSRTGSLRTLIKLARELIEWPSHTDSKLLEHAENKLVETEGIKKKRGFRELHLN